MYEDDPRFRPTSGLDDANEGVTGLTTVLLVLAAAVLALSGFGALLLMLAQP